MVDENACNADEWINMAGGRCRSDENLHVASLSCWRSAGIGKDFALSIGLLKEHSLRFSIELGSHYVRMSVWIALDYGCNWHYCVGRSALIHQIRRDDC